jgi:hypothetical protein
MANDAYTEEMEARLGALGDYLDTLTFPAPSTQAADEQRQLVQRFVMQLQEKIAAAKAKVAELRESPGASYGAAREEIDARWDEIVRMRESLA